MLSEPAVTMSQLAPVEVRALAVKFSGVPVLEPTEMVWAGGMLPPLV